MKSMLVCLAVLVAATAAHAGKTPGPRPLPKDPPPPVFVAPTPVPGRVETGVVLSTNTVIVTNVVPFTGVAVVTNAVQVTNATLVTNVIPPPAYVYEQRPLTGRPTLVTPEQAQAVIDKFRAGYPKLGNPRFVLYVNRELVDERSGVQLANRTERATSVSGEIKGQFKPEVTATANTTASSPTNQINISGGSVTVVGDVASGAPKVQAGAGQVTYQSRQANEEMHYRVQERSEMTLADRQTIRDVERLFGRPLRLAGASLADQRVATQLIGNRSSKDLTTATDSEVARKDREALASIADVAIEVLISSRNITVPEVSGNRTYAVPDIHATAIRLSDARILGQATAADIIGRGQYAGHVSRNFDIRDMAEATALSLMEDLMLGIQP